jgi:hypothetical protein
MAGNEVLCAICGKWLPADQAVEMRLTAPGMEPEECQLLFVHKACLQSVVQPAVPLHPDLVDE